MTQSAAELFFSLQSELINAKVDTAVDRSFKEIFYQVNELRQEIRQGMSIISREINQVSREIYQEIAGLRREMHQEIGGLRREIHMEISTLRMEISTLRVEINDLRVGVSDLGKDISNLEKDMVAVKTRLGIRDQTLHQIRGHFIEYTFKTSWLVMLASISGVVSFLATRIH